MKEEKRDYKMIVGMIVLLGVLVLIAGSFWSVVAKQAELVRQEEEQEDGEALSAIYIETGGSLKLQVFVDMENGTIFTAPVPEAGIYNKNGTLVKDDVLENGDTVKIYGDGMMAESFPGQYNGVTKIQRTGRASLEETQKYMDMVEEALRGI